ncbi:MAG TPA: D-alanyl-D-alanine carboxypeptidase/D-alanyl-D-alanine-endopeptidase, partial [Candidatus Limnocylindria bacterium]|nr:D-alanyl-D-alanine carboxypeptidase/D-alanyl-D-alanine-endopeptidase [Candidatus Limnocylindria bacterium]
KAAGVKRLAGDLVCDEGAFHGPPYGSGWAWDALATKYGPPVSALTFNDNVVHLTLGPAPAADQPVSLTVAPAFAVATNRADGEPLVIIDNSARTVAKPHANTLRFERPPGSSRIGVAGELPVGADRVGEDVSVPSPARFFGLALREALALEGITVAGRVRVAETHAADEDAAWHELAALPSPSVGELVRLTLKPSQNLYAQLLLLATGAETERYPRDTELAWPRAVTTEQAGLRALEAFLKTAGIAKGEVLLEEGSGMSRANVVTANALVQLLTHMNRHRWAPAWLDALPVGGVDGTLKTRFTAPPTKGNVRAKTGTLDGVSALAGYVTTAAGEHLVFALLVNNYAATGSTHARNEEDALVGLLAARTTRSQ